MNVLIAVSNFRLGQVWARHLCRNGADVVVVHDQAEAIAALDAGAVDIIVVDIVLATGSAIAIADYAGYRRPDAKIIFVSNSSFFSDGSIFQHIPNARAVVPEQVSADDLGAVVEYHAAV